MQLGEKLFLQKRKKKNKHELILFHERREQENTILLEFKFF